MLLIRLASTACWWAWTRSEFASLSSPSTPSPLNLLLQDRVGPGQLGRALAHATLQLVVGLAEGLLGLLPPGDVEGDPLEVEGVALLVAHHLGLAMDPDHAAVAGQEPVLGAEMPPRGAGPRELGVPADAIVRVELPVPEDRVLRPFLLREAQQRLDLRADVQLVVLLLERRHEGDGRQLLDEGAIAGLGPAELLLAADRLLVGAERRDGRRRGPDHRPSAQGPRPAIAAGQPAQDVLGLAGGQHVLADRRSIGIAPGP